jgi:multiple sugar transport system permease protein
MTDITEIVRFRSSFAPLALKWPTQRFLVRAGLHALVVALALMVLLPFLWLVQMSLRPEDEIFSDAVLFTPTLENYQALWQGNFAGSFLNSLAVSSLSTGLSLLLGVPAAYVLTRWRFRGRARVALWILTTRMAPPIAFTIPFFLAYRLLGLQDTV